MRGNHIKVYSIYNKKDEIKWIGTAREIVDMSGVKKSMVDNWIANRVAKYEAYHVGYADDILE